METRKRRAAPPFLKRHELKRCFITLKLFCLAHNSFLHFKVSRSDKGKCNYALSTKVCQMQKPTIYISSQETSVLVTEPIITLKFKNENLYYFEIVRLKLSAVKAKNRSKEKKSKKRKAMAQHLNYYIHLFAHGWSQYIQHCYPFHNEK